MQQNIYFIHYLCCHFGTVTDGLHPEKNTFRQFYGFLLFSQSKIFWRDIHADYNKLLYGNFIWQQGLEYHFLAETGNNLLTKFSRYEQYSALHWTIPIMKLYKWYISKWARRSKSERNEKILDAQLSFCTLFERQNNVTV